MLLTERLEEDTGSGEGRKCASSWHVLHPALTRACACDDTLTVQSPVFIQSVSVVYHQRGGEEAWRLGALRSEGQFDWGGRQVS